MDSPALCLLGDALDVVGSRGSVVCDAVAVVLAVRRFTRRRASPSLSASTP